MPVREDQFWFNQKNFGLVKNVLDQSKIVFVIKASTTVILRKTLWIIIQFWKLWQPQNQYQTWIKWTRNILIWLSVAKVAWWNIIDQSWHLYTMQHGDKVIYPKYYKNSNDLVLWLFFWQIGSVYHRWNEKQIALKLEKCQYLF